MFDNMLIYNHFKEQSYKDYMKLKRLTETYSEARFENTYRRVVKGTRVNYGTIKTILPNNLDGKMEQPLEVEYAIVQKT